MPTDGRGKVPRVTERQRAVLHIVQLYGPIGPADVDYHGFTASVDAARASLARLNARGLVEANYTYGNGLRTYTITEKGARAVGDAFGEDEDA